MFPNSHWMWCSHLKYRQNKGRDTNFHPSKSIWWENHAFLVFFISNSFFSIITNDSRKNACCNQNKWAKIPLHSLIFWSPWFECNDKKVPDWTHKKKVTICFWFIRMERAKTSDDYDSAIYYQTRKKNTHTLTSNHSMKNDRNVIRLSDIPIKFATFRWL